MASQGRSIPAVPTELMLQPHNAYLADIRTLLQYGVLAVILNITTVFIHTLLRLNPKEEGFFFLHLFKSVRSIKIKDRPKPCVLSCSVHIWFLSLM